MHIGLRLPSNGPNAAADHIVKTGRLAEKLGFDSLWGNDHIIMPSSTAFTSTYGRLFEVLITLAALSTATKRVRLGTGVLILPLRNPILVAKQLATLDAFANGRMLLGIGVGWEQDEYRFLNTDFTQRGIRCDEWMKIIRTVWQGKGINISTETYNITDGVSEPAPVQTAGPPILVGGDSDAALKRAAQRADGWLPGSHLSVKALAAGVQKIKTLAPVDHKGIFYAFRRPSGSFAEEHVVDQMVSTLNALYQTGVQGCILALPEDYSSDTFTDEVRLFAEHVMPYI